jgi:hypothetical protein
MSLTYALELKGVHLSMPIYCQVQLVQNVMFIDQSPRHVRKNEVAVLVKK